jgi:hypothetical protein
MRTVVTAAQFTQTTFQASTSDFDHVLIAVNDTPGANAHSAGWVIADMNIAAPANLMQDWLLR